MDTLQGRWVSLESSFLGDCGFKSLRPHGYYKGTMWILDLPVRAAGLGC